MKIYYDELISLIKNFLNGKVEFDIFFKEFENCYIEKVPKDYDFTELEWDFFGAVNEQAGWTSEEPGEDRQYGYINIEEFRVWLKKSYAEFQSGDFVSFKPESNKQQ